MLHVYHIPGLGDLVLSLKSLTCVCKSQRGGMQELSQSFVNADSCSRLSLHHNVVSAVLQKMNRNVSIQALSCQSVCVCLFCLQEHMFNFHWLQRNQAGAYTLSIIRTLSSFLPHMKCELKSEFTKITLSSVFNILFPCVFSLHHRITFEHQ